MHIFYNNTFIKYSKCAINLINKMKNYNFNYRKNLYTKKIIKLILYYFYYKYKIKLFYYQIS